jgi:hypothetical protein
MFKDNFDIHKVNTRKLIRTVRGSMKKALFYLGAGIPYHYIDNLVTINPDDLKTIQDKKIKKIINIDAKIRYCDDILDNELAKQNPRPVRKMKETIDKFEEQVPEAREVANLFRCEMELLDTRLDGGRLKEKIKNLIEIRPNDYFVLVNIIVDFFGSRLSSKDYKKSFEFYQEFQRLRDLFDDIMSIEEDILKKDYNSVVLAKMNGVPASFFEEIIKTKFINLDEIASEIDKHPYKNIFQETIKFWVDEYNLLFKKLLIDYYVNIEQFGKSYFMIKQL